MPNVQLPSGKLTVYNGNLNLKMGNPSSIFHCHVRRKWGAVFSPFPFEEDRRGVYVLKFPRATTHYLGP